MKEKNGFFSLENRMWQLLVLLALGITWGSSFMLMKQGLKAFNGFEVAVIRLSFSFLFLLPFLWNDLRKIPRKKYLWLALAGWLGNGLPSFLFAIGLSRINSSLGGIINSTAPIFTLIIGSTLFGLHFKKAAIGGILIGLAGTVYLVATGSGSGNSSNLYYALLPLLGSVCYGFSTNIIKTRLYELKPMVVTGGALSFVAPVVIPLMFVMQLPSAALQDNVHATAFFYSALLGVVGTSLAVLVFNYLIKHTSVLFAASVTYIIPVFAMAWGFVFGEDITVHYFLGMGIIILGVWLVNRAK